MAFLRIFGSQGNKNNSPSLPSVTYHSNILIGENVFIWGGGRPDTPLVHDSPEKRQFTSSITAYNILQSSLDTLQTTGTPPNGIMGYSSCCIGEDIYYFGGRCMSSDCFHNNLYVLNTTSRKWREIDHDNGPMKKDRCGMIHFHISGEDYILVVGGIGPVPARDTPGHYKYIPHPYKPSWCFTNEVHIMCVSSTPGKWIVPVIIGSEFPPLAWFSINTLPGNRAIVFGGLSIAGETIASTNHMFILTYSAIKNSLYIQKLTNPSDPSIQWPVERSHHASVIITSVSSNGERKHHLLVMGGTDDNRIIPDALILSIDHMKSNKVVLPEVVSGRCSHSMTCFKMYMNCVWLLITGGINSSMKTVSSNIVELVFSPSDDKWSASIIMDEEDMMNKAQYTKLVSDRLTAREKEYQLIMESTVPVTTEPGLTVKRGEEQVELLKQQLVQKDEQNQKVIEEIYRNLKRKDQVIMEKEEVIQQKDETIRSKEETLRQNNDIIHRKEEEIMSKNDTIRQKDELLQQKQHQILNLRSQLENPPWVIQDEEVNVTNTIIGGGSYGEVRVAVFRGARVAAKLLHELIVSRHNKNIFTREMEISSGIHHPNIVQFIGATRINNPILLYELMPISLHKRLQDDESLSHAQIVNIGSDICTAMCYLHQWRPQPIIHRDISSPNVLMDPLPNDKWRAKLSDFGSAKLQMHISTKNPGNPFYSAPEADNPRHHSPAMDVYSFGVVLTEMTLHRVPELDHEQSARSIDWVEMRGIVLECINDDRRQRSSSKRLLIQLQKL